LLTLARQTPRFRASFTGEAQVLQETIFEKTELGSVEITANTPTLTAKQRRVLIMIDGRRSVSDLALMLKPGEIELVIATLLEQNMIATAGVVGGQRDMRAVVAANAPAAVRAIPVPAPLASLQHLLMLQKKATRIVESALGMGAMDVCLKIEKTKTVDELAAFSVKVLDILNGSGHRVAAEQYRKEVLGY
jgi:hypothetical protein